MDKKLDVLVENLRQGNSVLKSCNNAKVSRPEFYYQYRVNEKFRIAVEDAKLSRCIILEDAAFKKATEGNATLIIFLLCNWLPEKYKHLSQLSLEHKLPANIEIKITDAKKNKILSTPDTNTDDTG